MNKLAIGLSVVLGLTALSLKAADEAASYLRLQSSVDVTYGAVPLTVKFAAAVSDVPPINFKDHKLESYQEDVKSKTTIEDDGTVLHMVGNAAKAIAFPYQITKETVLEFDFKSGAEGEVHGIGLDTDLEISGERTFVVYGQEGWGLALQQFHDYAPSEDGWRHYSIPVGRFYTGGANYLFFMTDHDVENPTAESYFRNVTVYGGGEAGKKYTVKWDFGDGKSAAGEFKPVHTYTTAGRHKVVLTVSDGKQTVRRSIDVTAKAPPPVTRTLFIDDEAIEEAANLKRVLNQPLKHPYPIVTGDRPWDAYRPQVYGTVMHFPAEKLLKMWYLSIPGHVLSGEDPPIVGGFPRVQHTTLVGYATSKDGIHWEKPNLGVLDFNGSKDNSLVNMGRDNTEGVSVLYEPDDPDPDRRYKAIYWEHTVAPPQGRPPLTDPRKDGMWVSFSRDGIHWTDYKDNPVVAAGSDSGQCVLFDPLLKKYVLYSRLGVGRRVSRCQSEDFIHWTPAELVFAADKEDGPNAQIYGIGVGIYEGLYIGMPWMYYAGTDLRIDVQLIDSRDGVQWHRTGNRATFLPNGPEGAWDSGIIFTACRPVVLDDRILIYYFGMQGNHASHPDWEESKRYWRGSLGVATLRRDGWVSLDAGVSGGSLLTKPLVVPGPTGGDVTPRLIINTNVFSGQVTVCVLDVDGKPIGGFEKSKTLHGDFLRAEVTWPGKTLAELTGKKVRLRIDGKLAKLYSYWFE